MENNATSIELLIQRVEEYSKTTLTLLKLNAVDKSADMIANVVIKLVLTLIVALFLLTFSIGLSLWAGELLGKLYYGFFAVTVFYILLASIMYIFRTSWIGGPVRDAVIVELLKKEDHENRTR